MRFLRSYSGFSCSGFYSSPRLLLAVSVYGQNAEPEVVLTQPATSIQEGTWKDPVLRSRLPFRFLQSFCQESDLFFANLKPHCHPGPSLR